MTANAQNPSKPCPKCGEGKPVEKSNRSPRSWLECDNCGWHLTDSVECWDDVADMAREAAAVPSLLHAAEFALDYMYFRQGNDAAETVTGAKLRKAIAKAKGIAA